MNTQSFAPHAQRCSSDAQSFSTDTQSSPCNTRRVRTNGTELHVCEYSTLGEPVLFLHPGVQTASSYWAPVLPYFVEQYRVLTVDLRGHGRSEWPATGHEVGNLAEDVRGVLDALGLQSVHLVGNSLGADVALCLAAAHPDRVRSLSSIDALMLNINGPWGEREQTKEEMIHRAMTRELPEYETVAAFIEEQRTHWLPWNEHKQLLIEQTELRRLPNGRFSNAVLRETAAQIVASLADLRIEELYPRVKCPMLFLPATEEPLFEKKLAFLEHHRAILPEHQVVVIPDSWHLMMGDHPQELSRAVLQFLAEVEAKS